METKIDGLTNSQSKLEENNREDHDKLFGLINGFIRTANDKYATKVELTDFKKSVSKYKDITRGWVKSTLPLILSVVTLLILAYSIIPKGGVTP